MSHPITKTSVCSSESSLHQTISLDEEIPEVNFISEPESYQNDDFIKVMLDTFKKEENLTLKEKLEITYFISIAVANFNEDMVREFNEEECHLAMLNWVYKYGKKLKEFRVENDIKNSIKLIQNFDNFFPNYNNLLIEINFIMQLLINILNIFITLPITSNEILNLKLYEKLSKIKKFIKPFAIAEILNLVDTVLNKWKTQIDSENEQKIIARFRLNKLGIKRNRPVEEKFEEQVTEADSVGEDTNSINNIKNNNFNIHGNININKKIKNKNIKVSFDFSRNSFIYFNKDDTPLQISFDKQNNKINDISNFSQKIQTTF